MLFLGQGLVPVRELSGGPSSHQEEQVSVLRTWFLPGGSGFCQGGQYRVRWRCS